MTRTIAPPQIVLDGAAATGPGNKIYVMDYEHITVSIHTSGSTNATIKAQGSQAENADDVDFDSAQSPTNRWDYIQLRDYEDASSLDGDTGLVLSGTDDNRELRYNVDGLRYVTLNLTAYSAGAVTAYITGYNNS